MKKYYIYLYLDPTKSFFSKINGITLNYEPFYVGLGQNKRDKSHLHPSSLEIKSYKNSKIKSLLTQNKTPIIIRIYEGLTFEEAERKEKEIISFFGRRDNNKGILCNHTDGGQGWNNTQVKNKIKKKKIYYCYSLDGKFINSYTYDKILEMGINLTNIPTAIKRNGTCKNFIWSFKYQGEQITPTIKYKQKIGFSNEEKQLIKELYLEGKSIQFLVKYFESTSEKIRKELTFQGIYKKQKLSNQIKQLTKKNDLIKIWDKAFTIQKELGFNSGTILECCKGHRKTYKNFKWEFYEK